MNQATAPAPPRESIAIRVNQPPPRTGGDVSEPGPAQATDPVIELKHVEFYYGSFRAVKDISISVPPRRITALIGPSGCGKSTLLRTINRMNDLIPGTRLEGEMLYHGENLYAKDVDPVEVRRRIGMVFQKANPFPKSIYDNVAFGPRDQRHQGRHGRDRRVLAAPRGPLGRGQGQAQAVGSGPLRRTAATPLYRPGHRHLTGRDPHGRTMFRRWTRVPRSRSRT